MWEYGEQAMDLDYIYSNDIYAILTHYGVEAARQSIINESVLPSSRPVRLLMPARSTSSFSRVSGVFAVYGININFRHLSLLADYMVRRRVIFPRSS